MIGAGLELTGNRFGFFDTGLMGSGWELNMTRCGIVDNCLVFIDTNFGSIVTRLGLIYIGLESTGAGLGFIGNRFGFFDTGLIYFLSLLKVLSGMKSSNNKDLFKFLSA